MPCLRPERKKKKTRRRRQGNFELLIENFESRTLSWFLPTKKNIRHVVRNSELAVRD